MNRSGCSALKARQPTAAFLALLTTAFAEGPERTRAVSLYAAVVGVGATLGLVAGGMFAGWLSWRVGFFINAPIGLALALAAPRARRQRRPHAQHLGLPPAPPTQRAGQDNDEDEDLDARSVAW